MRELPVALITGCSTGLGLSAALELARRDHHVVATMRNLAKAGELRERAAAESLTVDIVALDVTDGASVRRAVDEVLERTGNRLDAVVNNAAISIEGPVEELSDEEILAVYETNVFGVMRVTRAILPAMRARRRGTIVNISSVAGLVTMPYHGLYASSKRALEAFSEALRMEVAPFGIKVAIVEPDFFRTNIGQNATMAARTTETSPYWAPTKRTLDVVVAGVERGADPQEAAALIADIAEMAEPRLRYVTPAASEPSVRALTTMSDDDRAAMFHRMLIDDAEGAANR